MKIQLLSLSNGIKDKHEEMDLHNHVICAEDKLWLASLAVINNVCLGL